MRDLSHTPFDQINRGFDATFQAGRLSVGLVLPITRYDDGPIPDMTGHLDRAILAESLGFAALWLRDVPFAVPSFGDAGQLFDPFTYLGYLAARTSRIALGVASIVLPLRHPAHVAKAAASVDALSGGRLILGVASGDRPEEFPAMGKSFETRDRAFREAFDYIRAMGLPGPRIDNGFGRSDGRIEMLPKPTGPRLPLMVTGSSRQSPDWIARNADGWMTYPRPGQSQAQVLAGWRDSLQAAGQPAKPVLQPLYVDLAADPDEGPSPIHLGFRSGHRFLLRYLQDLRAAGVNHVALNLRFNRADTNGTLDRLAHEVLPHFHEGAMP
ncbi:LLM class oxidoreductase [Paracoccus sp. 1_MG-2023]|uniref:LLM class oxidoreductase n=1 Tax=unclassified Paracoccus (in: a-proteobacteria) TaxID=2688777 RepID=UPI001C08F533|nr:MULTISPECIES: LLM class oxidoreductase [unclassified Paracoccus (in: a-proteobacteria)]MBU2956054.1 LLM class oxidoreductase [Paracoccus sp. C2R09]MDO6669460.1 LLM class oxidoreductase [Paracoccus sp. 1_MG-2023]